MKKSILTLVFLNGFCAVALAGTTVKVPIQGTTPDSKVTGEVTLSDQQGALFVEAKVANVAPGKHGFHFHENGSCDEQGKAAGGHFNPDKVQHGLLMNDGHEHAHAGDMGNIEVGPDGTGTLRETLPGLSLTQGKYAVDGKAIILHEKEDDFSQPTGNAGGRIGCGVIHVTTVKDSDGTT